MNTAPTTQNGTVVWLLEQISFQNWQIFAYENAEHNPHHLQKDSPYQMRIEKKKPQEITIPDKKLDDFGKCFRIFYRSQKEIQMQK
jgi:hypothetical protein